MEYMSDGSHSNDEMLTRVSRQQIDWLHCFVHVVLLAVTIAVVVAWMDRIQHFANSWIGGGGDDDNVVVIYYWLCYDDAYMCNCVLAVMFQWMRHLLISVLVVVELV